MPAHALMVSGLAKRVDVSKATVSKALSPYTDRSDIGAATCERNSGHDCSGIACAVV